MEDKKPPLKALFAIIWIIVIFVVWFVAIEEYTLQTGQEVYLETMPVDPRDPLRWDYVILRYEIERDEKIQEFINTNTIAMVGKTLYISLKEEDNIGIVESVSISKPKNGLFIRWKISEWNGIDLWIWKYFVPEGTWREIEKVRSDMKVLTVIDKYGTAKIKNLYYEDKIINPDTFIAK